MNVQQWSSVSHSLNDNTVCRTAQATPGLWIIFFFYINLSIFSEQYNSVQMDLFLILLLLVFPTSVVVTFCTFMLAESCSKSRSEDCSEEDEQVWNPGCKFCNVFLSTWTSVLLKTLEKNNFFDTWHVTRDTWQMTHDTWHVTHNRWGRWTFLKFQLPSSYALGVKVFWGSVT